MPGRACRWNRWHERYYNTICEVTSAPHPANGVRLRFQSPASYQHDLQPVGDKDDHGHRVDDLQCRPVLDENGKHSRERLAEGEEDVDDYAAEGTHFNGCKLSAWREVEQNDSVNSIK